MSLKNCCIVECVVCAVFLEHLLFSRFWSIFGQYVYCWVYNKAVLKWFGRIILRSWGNILFNPHTKTDVNLSMCIYVCSNDSPFKIDVLWKKLSVFWKVGVKNLSLGNYFVDAKWASCLKVLVGLSVIICLIGIMIWGVVRSE